MNVFGNKSKEKPKMREGEDYIPVNVRGRLIFSFVAFCYHHTCIY